MIGNNYFLFGNLAAAHDQGITLEEIEQQVEVPHSTFHPVKSLFDLLPPEHQP